MFVKRVAHLKLLEEQYASESNNLVVLYGRKGLGKTTLLTEFMEGKPAVYYYEATECEEKLQLYFMKNQLTKITYNEPSSFLSNPDEVHTSALPAELSLSDYSYLFTEFIKMHQEKSIIILDEFHFLLKNNRNMLDALSILGNSKRPVMFILCSSSIRWVENEMLDCLGPYATYITAYRKLKEFTFVELVNRFPKASVETCIYINAILGGVPDYLNDWQEGLSLQENIVNLLFNKNSRLFFEPSQFLKEELREPAVYNTILFALAMGNRKLNELHKQTGFSRAKISVYLKHLIQLDLVEKVIPLNEEGNENVQKGFYRIRDNFFSFWYRFVFPNRSDFMAGKENSVYDEYINPQLNDFMGEYFADVCTEFLKLMSKHQRLPGNYLWWERWYGKNGTIDILAQGENKKTLVGKCLWQDSMADISDYEKLISLSKEAGVTPDYCYLFSRNGFSKELRSMAKEKENVQLVGLEDL